MSELNSESGGNSSKSVYESYCFIHGAKSCKGDSSSPNVVPNAKWWSNHLGDGRFFSHDQLSLLDAELKLVNTSYEENVEKQLIDDYYSTFSKNDSSYMQQKQFCTDCKVNQDSFLRNFECMTDDNNLLSTPYSVDFESSGGVPVEMSKKLFSDLDLSCIEPWWQATDKVDIRSNVSQRSAHDIIGSDLVESRDKFMEKVPPDDYITRFDQVEHLKVDKETNILRGDLASVADMNISCSDDSSRENCSSASKSTVEKQGLAQCLQQDRRGTLSSISFNPAKVVSSTSSDTSEPTSGNLSRAQLLEALCHSQTRAREAEKLAQVACDEKDHMINLFFQQASCLFAYRQWLRLLQLETICLHLKSRDQAKSLTTPIVRKNHHKAASKKNHGKPKCSVRKCAIAFAVGMSLAGAGFLVGWTIGLFFPAF